MVEQLISECAVGHSVENFFSLVSVAFTRAGVMSQSVAENVGREPYIWDERVSMDSMFCITLILKQWPTLEQLCDFRTLRSGTRT